MKPSFRHPILPFAIALALFFVLTSPLRLLAEAPPVVSLSELKQQLTLLQTQITASVDSLNAVKDSAKSEPDLKKAAADFSQHMQSLNAQAESVRQLAVTAKARSKAAYDAWQKELLGMQNPALREKALGRLASSKEEFDKIIAKASKAKEEMLPFVSDLKDIDVYLNADPSAEAVKSLSNTIWKLGNRTQSVVDSIGEVNKQIERTIKSLPQK